MSPMRLPSAPVVPRRRGVPGATGFAACGAPFDPSGRSRWPPRAFFGAATRPRAPQGPTKGPVSVFRKLHGRHPRASNPRIEQPRSDPVGSQRSTTSVPALLILTVARAQHAGRSGDQPATAGCRGGAQASWLSRARATGRRPPGRCRASRAAPPNSGWSRHPCAALRGFAPPHAAGCDSAAAPLDWQ